MTRSGTEAVIVFMRQKIRYLFLTCKGVRWAVRLAVAAASISGFQFAKTVNDGTFRG
jgi:hypothetical protein